MNPNKIFKKLMQERAAKLAAKRKALSKQVETDNEDDEPFDETDNEEIEKNKQASTSVVVNIIVPGTGNDHPRKMRAENGTSKVDIPDSVTEKMFKKRQDGRKK